MFVSNIIKETARGLQPIPIEDELLGKRIVFLTEEVTAESASGLIKQLMYLECSGPGQEICFVINSPGGDVAAGLSVYDYIRLMSSPVRTLCIGTAASMGSILFLAGDRREMLPHARIMIHDPSYGGGSYEGKKPDELREDLERLDKSRRLLSAIISERTGKTMAQVAAKTRKDTYFDAKEAIEFGLATGIITSPLSFDPD